MKPNSQKFSGQVPGTNGAAVGTNSSVLFKIQKYPILYIGLSWIVYSAVDIFSRELLDLDYSLFLSSVNLIFALSVSPVLFYGIFPGLRTFWHDKQQLMWAIIILFILLIIKIATDVTLITEMHPPLHTWVFGGLRIFSCMLIVFPVWVLTLTAEKYEHQLIAQLTAHKLKLENHTLKYNPHLFLNILNDINGKAAGLSTPLFDDLTHLNNFFRYALCDENEKNSLIIQMDVIKSFLHCQNLRFPDSVFLEHAVVMEPSLLTKSIFFPESGLIDLVHNMYIHGDLSDPSHPGRLSITLLIDREIDCPVLSFQSHNRIKGKRTQRQGGFGNEATSKFLKQLFPSSRWEESVQENVYTLEITLIFNCYDKNRYS
ncbi:histidine kinase [Algoriphagus sp. D3-2-R+10]|uniref:sensor histidine kinase n=1 Tax=Algoriphagus aurantiacus TaxID=3103948 RepID=UPI002B3DE6D5|nr:histidine kinase [Algoriphagus sp. D3-2-R+10]MEB2778449.1 histidine kinase [Algoriphagus sp. D3-2-R+10]